MKSLIERQGAIAAIAPSMREIPYDDNPAAFQFAEDLLAGRIDIVVFMTGVGATALMETLQARYERPQILAAMDKTTVVVRGPKPTAVLRGWNVRIDHRAPEPNTWREVIGIFENAIPLEGRTVAVQEYGAPSTELYEKLESKGASVRPVPVYRWALPLDIEPLKAAIRHTIANEFDVLLFTSAQQLNHILEVAAQDGLRADWLDAANRVNVIASIGPTATETLKAAGLKVDIQPEHPNMGSLVKEALALATDLPHSKS